MVKVSAPGKLMLFGEHAVVYGRPCIVTAVDHRLSLEVETVGGEGQVQLSAPDLDFDEVLGVGSQLSDIPKEAKFVMAAVNLVYNKHSLNSSLKISTKSEFKSTFGFGSSSATTVCTVAGLSELFDLKLSKREVFDLALEAVLNVQGKGSGFDVAAAVYGGTLYYQNQGEVIEELGLDSFNLLAGYTGIKYDTVELINQIKKTSEKYPGIIDSMYDNMGEIVELAKDALLKNDMNKVGELMNINQGLLDTIGVSSIELSSLVFGARAAGAYGAKLSGAGGGDCMVALTNTENTKKVVESLNTNGEYIPIRVNAQGVTVHQ